MSLAHILLAYLSRGPASGYELKKLVAESAIMPWSGNNNQIYRTLIELAEQGLAESKLEQGEHGPSRKPYAISAAGLAELRRWLRTPPELPELRNGLLWRLTWAELLTQEEVDTLLRRHEDELYLELRMRKEKRARGMGPMKRPDPAASLWDGLVADYLEEHLEFEMSFCRKARRAIEVRQGRMA